MTDPAISEYLSNLGKKGAAAANRKRTPKQRKRMARKAARARWEKEKKEKQ